MATDYRDMAFQVALEFGLDPDLFDRLIEQESGFNPKALSSAGAMGLTQLMPATAKYRGVTDPWDPMQNLRGGAGYLKEQLDTFGTPELALAAYNAGPEAVRKHGGVPPYKETQNYTRRILKGYSPAAAKARAVTPMQIPQAQMPMPTDMQMMPAAAQTAQAMSPWEDPMFWLSLAGGINPSADNPFAGIAPSLAQYSKARLEQQLTQARSKLPPSRIREVKALAQTYGVSPEQAMRMVYPSGSEYGVTPRMQGGVMYEEFTLPGGQRGYRMVDTTQQQAREQVLTAEERAKGYGTAAGPEQVAYVKSIGEGAAANQSILEGTNRMLEMFESGEMDKLTGPIRGHITRLYEPNARLLEAHAVRRTLDNLQIANLAPVSNYEIQLLRNLDAGVYATKKQNIAVLRELQRAQKKRADYFDDVSVRLRRGETWEGILLDPPEVDFKPDKSLLPSGEGAKTYPVLPPGWEMGSDGVIRRIK